MSGIMLMILGASNSANIQLIGNTALAVGSLEASDATAIVTFNTDGTLVFTDAPSLPFSGTNWATPTTAGIGNGYNISANVISASTSGLTPSTNTFQSLATTFQLSAFASSASVGITQGAWEVKIWSGGTVLASNTFQAQAVIV